MKTEQRLAALEQEEFNLRKTLDEDRGNMRFKCGCGNMHTIRLCSVIQTYWYTPPRGCMEGDYWNTGELQIICPDTDKKNRLFFDSAYKVDWALRRDFAHSAEAQFKRYYKHLFKEVIDNYDKDKRSSWNNNYFDDNRERFGLHVEGLDKPHK
jgi:hypothetical protein